MDSHVSTGTHGVHSRLVAAAHEVPGKSWSSHSKWAWLDQGYALGWALLYGAVTE
jgi:hypothetical protein